MRGHRMEDRHLDTALAGAVSLAYAIAKVGHAVDGRAGIPGGPTLVTDRTSGIAEDQWILVALGLLAAVIAIASDGGVFRHRVLAAVRWVVVTGVALLTTLGTLVIVGALFESDHPLRWSQPIAATVSCVGAVAWLHLAIRLRPRR